MQHLTFIHVSDLHLDYFPPVRQERQEKQERTETAGQDNGNENTSAPKASPNLKDNAVPKDNAADTANQADELSVYLHEAPYEALKNLVSLCEEVKPQFIVFSGDIHEHGILSLKARFALTDFFNYLKKQDIPFYYACGNHDHLGQNDNFFQEFDNIYRFGENWGYFTYPPANKNDIRKNETAQNNTEESAPLCTLFGISHTSRKELKNLVKDFPNDFSAENTNSQGLPHTPFNIGILHASVHNQENVKNTDKHVVALCREWDFYEEKDKTASAAGNAIKNNMDYWALGHIHEPMLLRENPTLMYAGAMQASRMSETGMRGAIVVKMAKQSHFAASALQTEKDSKQTDKNLSVPFQQAKISTVFYPLAPLEIYGLSLAIDENAEIPAAPNHDIPVQAMKIGKPLEDIQENPFTLLETKEDCLTYFTRLFDKEYAKIHSNPLCRTRLFNLYLEGQHALYEQLQDEEFLIDLQNSLEQAIDGQNPETKIIVRSVKSLVRPSFHYELAHKREDLLGEVFRVLDEIRQDPALFAQIVKSVEQDIKIKNELELDIFSYSDKYTQTQLEQFRQSLLHQCESICVKFLEPK